MKLTKYLVEVKKETENGIFKKQRYFKTCPKTFNYCLSQVFSSDCCGIRAMRFSNKKQDYKKIWGYK